MSATRTTFVVGDRVRLNAYFGRDDFAATGVVVEIRDRPDGSPDYVVRLDVPVTSGDMSMSLLSRAADALRLDGDATTNDDALVLCEVCGEHPATDAVRDPNGNGPWIDVCVVCAEHPTWSEHADDCDCGVCAEDDGAVVTDDDEVARVLAADDRRGAGIVRGERDGEVYVVTSNVHGQALVFVFRTLDGARTYYDAVTTDYERNE